MAHDPRPEAPFGAPPPPPQFAPPTGSAIAAPQYAPPPPPPQQWGPVPAPQVKTNGLAIASLVLGLLWIWALGSILGIIFGHIAMGQIDRSNGWQTGRGMALAGTILGYIGLGFTLLIVIAAAAGA